MDSSDDDDGDGDRYDLLGGGPKPEDGEPLVDLPHLRGEYRGSPLCGPLYADLQWAAMESHVMVILYCYPSSFAEAPMAEQVTFACVGYNPIYWLLLLGAIPCVLSGRWVHAAVGQGGPVRHDELEVEHEARVQWIYTTDGPFACAALFTVAELIAYAAEGGTLGANPTTLGLVLDFAIDAAYIGGNMLFVEAMKHKNVAQIRCAIAANATFAVGLVALLLESVDRVGWTTEWRWQQRATFAIRFGVVAFFIAATAIYARLWNAHGRVDPDATSAFPKPAAYCISSHALGILGIMLAAATVWSMLACVVVVGNPNYVWDALAGG